MSTYLSQGFLREQRERLEAQRAELINKSHLVRQDMRARERGPQDSIDDSTDERDTSTLLHLKDRESNLLAKINDALGRLDSDDYGYCENCEEEIGEARLRVRPMTTLCIDCQEDHEKAEQIQRSGNPGIFSELKL